MSVWGSILVIGFFIFLFYKQLRRLDYRKVAEELGAEYQSQSPLKLGKIAGSSNGRKYAIETKKNGTGRGASNWTTISISSVNKGIPLEMEGRFFKPFPNWKYASTRGDPKERVSVTDLPLQKAPVPLEEKCQLQVQGLFQEIVLLHSDLLSKGRLEIQQDQISFTTRGVLDSVEAARQTIALLARVADRTESQPVT